jgi:hypothetical protein
MIEIWIWTGAATTVALVVLVIAAGGPVRAQQSAMEIDQRQKDVCPPGQSGQSGQEGHILVAHGDLRE